MIDKAAPISPLRPRPILGVRGLPVDLLVLLALHLSLLKVILEEKVEFICVFGVQHCISCLEIASAVEIESFNINRRTFGLFFGLWTTHMINLISIFLLLFFLLLITHRRPHSIQHRLLQRIKPTSISFLRNLQTHIISR